MKIKPSMKAECDLTDQEETVVRELFASVAWKVFIGKVVTNKFNREYKKLRNTRREAESYERINGFLDGLEYIANCKEEHQG